MKIAISFSITLLDVHKRKVALANIDEFHVGCRRDHVFPPFPDQHKVPMEVSWLNSEPGFKSHYENVISRDLVDRNALHSWEIIRQWMEEKDAASKMRYSVGNYIDLSYELLKEGHDVWYHGEWQKLENFSHMEAR